MIVQRSSRPAAYAQVDRYAAETALARAARRAAGLDTARQPEAPLIRDNPGFWFVSGLSWHK